MKSRTTLQLTSKHAIRRSWQVGMQEGKLQVFQLQLTQSETNDCCQLLMYSEKCYCICVTNANLRFYPRDAMLARSLRQRRICLSVCPDVRHTPVLCLAERKQDREMYTI